MADGEVSDGGDGGGESGTCGVQKLNTCSNTDDTGKIVVDGGLICGKLMESFPGHGGGEGVSISEGNSNSEEGSESSQVAVTNKGPGGGHTFSKDGGNACVGG